MLGILKKLFFLGIVFVAVLLGILGIQTFLLFKNYQVNKEDLELRYGKEEERKKRLEKIEDIEREKREHTKLQIDSEKNKRYNPAGKAKVLFSSKEKNKKEYDSVLSSALIAKEH